MKVKARFYKIFFTVQIQSMKKILLIASIIAAGFTANAQQEITPSKTANTNVDTSYLTVKIPGYMDVVSFQLVQTRTSGTVGGYAVLQASLDGVNYNDISKDTCTFANVPINAKTWTVSPSPYSYYRVASRTSGTQVSVPSGYYLSRKH